MATSSRLAGQHHLDAWPRLRTHVLFYMTIAKPAQPAAQRGSGQRVAVLRLASVADDAAGVDVEADFADGQARLVAEARDETQEAPHVAEICREANRRADRASAFVAAFLHQSHEAI